ncbi:hypothetical protein A2U01_0028579, partial [Trifolium medium]|nr:hypothetical protein [Trifolium medium]
MAASSFAPTTSSSQNLDLPSIVCCLLEDFSKSRENIMKFDEDKLKL